MTGYELYRFRIKAGLTQVQLAKMLGTYRGKVVILENQPAKALEAGVERAVEAIAVCMAVRRKDRSLIPPGFEALLQKLPPPIKVDPAIAEALR